MEADILYAACRHPDPQVQAGAYQELWEYLYRVALHLVADQPEPEAVAQDCAQVALIRIHQRLEECREPAAFRAWSRRIASHIAIDELRRRRRLTPLVDEADDQHGYRTPESQPPAENPALEGLELEALRGLLLRAPISERSRRVVVGRFVDDRPDEELAREESELSGQQVLPSHIQVTRSKDIARLRDWQPLRAFLE